MSIIKFELKDKHIKLLKNLRWCNAPTDKMIVSVDNYDEPFMFGGDNIYQEIDLILNGKPINFDPLNSSDIPTYTSEQIEEWDKLLSELPLALEIILFNGNFNTGMFKAKFTDRQWKQLLPITLDNKQ
jgi:hypothetical protein